MCFKMADNRADVESSEEEEEEMSSASEEYKPHPCPASLFNILSGLYAIFLVILGAVLPIAEIFAQPVAINFFEAFYIYLYSVSFLFLVYVYAFLLQNRTSQSRKCAQQTDSTTAAMLGSNKVSIDSSGSHHTGSFYLRLGAVGFGIGSMILDGLRFGEFFEMDVTSPCSNILLAVRPMVHMAFTFVQLYFIFLNSKMCIHKYKILARFGLMHMVGTNICVWLRNTMKETLRALHLKLNNGGSLDNILATTPSVMEYKIVNGTTPQNIIVDVKTPPNIELTNNTANVTQSPIRTLLDCERRDIMGNVVDNAAPYLYPCTVMYSLIAAAILYTIWRNIGKKSRSRPISTTPNHNHQKENTTKPTRQIVDCRGTTKGLFVGILVLVATIISMIVFFVLIEKNSFKDVAVMVVHFSEMALHLLMSIGCIFAFFRVKDLYFNINKDIGLDEALLIISLTGVYIFSVFSIVAGYYNTITYGGTLIVTTATLELLESSVMTIFILNGLRRRSYKISHEETKPGREIVTFLMVCNIAMWGVNIFETRRVEANPVQLEFYGTLLWTIAAHISIPLNIFFRFHAAVCLCNIWKQAYKVKLK